MTSKDDAKTYLSKKEIPQLFESLMTGLMYHKPDDHVNYLQQCLHQLEGTDLNNIKWHMFVNGGKQSTPLPPINKANSEKRNLPPKDQSVLEMKKTNPLPPIHPLDLKRNLKYVVILGGPGSGKGEQSKRLAERYQGFVLISVGDLLRRQAEQLQDSDENRNVLSQLMKEGKLVSEEIAFTVVKNEVDRTLAANPANLMGFLIESFPRTTEQYNMFVKEFGKPAMIVSLESEDYLMKLRLKKRKESKLRVDDVEDAVANRMSHFKTSTMSVITQFQGQAGLLHRVKADRDSDEVFYDIANLMDEAFFERAGTTNHNNVPTTVDPLPPIATQTRSKEEGNMSQRAGVKDKAPSGQESDKAELSRQALVEEAVKLLEPIESTNQMEQDDVTGGRSFVKEELITKEDQQVLGDKGFIKSPEEQLKKTTIIFVSGGPGCGKGTQCAKIVQEYGFTHLSAGDLLRESASAGGERGRQIVDIMKAGTLVPHDITISLLKEAMLAKIDSSQGFLIDGFPRALDQGQVFEDQIAEGKLMLFFDVSDETLKRRLLTRAETSGREDDNEETIAKRLETFHNITAPVIANFAERKKLGKVSAESSPDDVYAEVQNIFREYNICKPGTVLDAKPTELKNKKIIFVIGGPGSGKGTQCVKIAERFRFTHLSSGDLLRSEVTSGSERGQELAAIMERGELVSQDIVLTLLKEKMLSEAAVSHGYLIDGYPREVQQGEAFETTIGQCLFALYFDASDDSMIARLLNRAKTSGRVDDNEETIKKRLETFHNLTKPVVDHYKKQDKLKLISAEDGPEKVFSEVVKLFQDSGFTSFEETASPEATELKQMKFTFVIGGPGSGKKEVAKNLASNKDAVYISAGNLIRSEVERDPEGTKEIAEAVSIGDIVHVNKVMLLIKEAITKFKHSQEFVIEGFPRTVAQAEAFSKEFGAAHKVILLSGTSEELEESVSSRAEMTGRTDDTGNAAKKKISTFFDCVTAVMEYYNNEDEHKRRIMKIPFKDACGDLTNILTFISFIDQ